MWVSASFPCAPLVGFAALLSAALACAADSGTGGSPPAEYGVPFVLAVGETRAVGGDGLALRLEGVPEDSRCPVDVTCIWEGEALVRLHAQAPAQEPRTLELRVRGSGGGSPAAEYGRFSVQVTRLEPAPVSTSQIPANAYRATVVVNGTHR